MKLSEKHKSSGVLGFYWFTYFIFIYSFFPLVLSIAHDLDERNEVK